MADLNDLGDWMQFAGGDMSGIMGKDDDGLSEEEKQAKRAAEEAERQRLAGAYQLAPHDPNYVQRTGQEIRQISQQGADFSRNMGVGAYQTAEKAQQDLTSIGTQGQRALTSLGYSATDAILDAAQAGQGALTGAAGQEAGKIASAGKAGQQQIYKAGALGAGDLAAAGENAQQALTSFGAQQARALRSAGTGALDSLATYGDTHSAALGALGSGAAQRAIAQGQAASNLAVQQGGAIAGTAAGAAGNIAAGALAQSSAINEFAARQAAAQAAAQGRQFSPLDFADADSLYSLAGSRAGDLAALEAVEGPSAAMAQLQTGLNAAQASSLALARSGRGFGGSASALSQAAVANAQAGQQAANQAAALRAQETAAWRQRQAANIGAAAGIEASLGEQQAAQTTAGAEMALRQQSLADQTALGYGAQQLGALTDAGNLALQGGLGAGQLALQGGQAGADLALRGMLGGGELGLSGSELEGRLAGEGARLGLDALSTGQGLALQAGRDASNVELQALSTGYGMGMQGVQGATDAQLRAAEAGGQLGLQAAGMSADTRLGGLESGYRLGIEGTRSAADFGLGALEAGYGMGLASTAQGADFMLRGGEQAAGLYGAGIQQSLQGIGQENTLYAQQAGLTRGEIQDDLTKYGIDKGVAVQQAAQDQALMGGLISAGAAALPLLLAASDRDAKEKIEPAEEIVMPMFGGGGPRGAEASGGGPRILGDRYRPISGPGGDAYDRAMASAARADRIYGDERERNMIEMAGPDRFSSGLGAMGQAFGRGLMATHQGDPYMFNPYARQYLASDVNSKTEIERLRGQVLSLGGNPSVQTSTQPVQTSIQPVAQPTTQPTMQPSVQPLTRPTLQPATQPVRPPTTTTPAATAPTTGQYGTRPMRAPAPATPTAPMMSIAPPAAPTSAPTSAPATQPRAVPANQQAQTQTQTPTPTPTFSLQSIRNLMGGNRLVASDARAKYRIAQLEDQVANMGGNPNDSLDLMPIVFDPRDGIYRKYVPEAEHQGGFVRGEPRGAPWDVEDPRLDTAALDEAYARQTGIDARAPDVAPPRRVAARGNAPEYRDITREDFFRGNDRVLGSGTEMYRPYSNVDVAALDDAYRRETGSEPIMPSPAAAARAIEKAPAYSYEYKDPERFGPGRYIGPMAQDLERTAAGRSVVTEAPSGLKMVDTSRLSLLNTAALHQMQERLDDLERGRPRRDDADAPMYNPYNFDRAALDDAYRRSAVAPDVFPGRF